MTSQQQATTSIPVVWATLVDLIEDLPELAPYGLQVNFGPPAEPTDRHITVGDVKASAQGWGMQGARERVETYSIAVLVAIRIAGIDTREAVTIVGQILTPIELALHDAPDLGLQPGFRSVIAQAGGSEWNVGGFEEGNYATANLAVDVTTKIVR
jgi:hypothetical protein